MDRTYASFVVVVAFVALVALVGIVAVKPLTQQPISESDAVDGVNFAGDAKGVPEEKGVPDEKKGAATPQKCKSGQCPDLDVTFIERTPRLERYTLNYEEDLYPVLTNPDAKHYFEIGDQVTLTAHVHNKGTLGIKNYGYRWIVGDDVDTTGVAGPLAPGEERTHSVTFSWPGGEHPAFFYLDNENLIEEVSEENNAQVLGRLDALSFRIVFSQVAYDAFNTKMNAFGSRSAEDWAQWQFEKWRETMDRSRYPESPNGAEQEFFIDKIEVLPAGEHGTALDNIVFDGSWVFAGCHPDWNPNPQTEEDYRACAEFFANATITTIDTNLQHELMHQLGIIDMYRLELGSEINKVDGRSFFFQNAGLMGGGDRGEYPAWEAYIDRESVAALNVNLNKRRGYYGEYLYDLPDAFALSFTDLTGQPLVGADVKVYQKRLYTEFIEAPAEFTLTTDANGRVVLPNKPVGRTFTTATGHSPKPNPYGDLHVVGINGLFYVTVDAFGQQGFAFVPVTEFNKRYWMGETESVTLAFQTDIIPYTLDPTNIALGKQVSASPSKPDRPASYAVDGDTTIEEQSWWAEYADPITAGAWIQVDLGQSYHVGQVKIYSNAASWQDMFRSYVILVGNESDMSDGVVVVQEPDWGVALAQRGYPVMYRFLPVEGRYVRILETDEMGEVNQWSRIQELEVYATEE